MGLTTLALFFLSLLCAAGARQRKRDRNIWGCVGQGLTTGMQQETGICPAGGYSCFIEDQRCLLFLKWTETLSYNLFHVHRLTLSCSYYNNDITFALVYIEDYFYQSYRRHTTFVNMINITIHLRNNVKSTWLNYQETSKECVWRSTAIMSMCFLVDVKGGWYTVGPSLSETKPRQGVLYLPHGDYFAIILNWLYITLLSQPLNKHEHEKLRLNYFNLLFTGHCNI